MEPAVDLSKVPVSVRRVDEVDERVEGGHGHVRESQVEQEIVGHCPHPFVRQNNPNDNQVSKHGHGQDRAVGHGPERHAPRGLRELVGQITAAVGPKGHSSEIDQRQDESEGAADRRHKSLWHH